MSYIRKRYEHFIEMQNGNMELGAVILIGINATADCERGHRVMSQ